MQHHPTARPAVAGALNLTVRGSRLWIPDGNDLPLDHDHEQGERLTIILTGTVRGVHHRAAIDPRAGFHRVHWFDIEQLTVTVTAASDVGEALEDAVTVAAGKGADRG
jgi:hypothetical protein